MNEPDSTQPARSLWHGWRTDTLWQVADRATRVGIGFLLSVVIARELGPGSFGLYSYALATVALFAFLGQAGLDSLLLRELVRHRESSATMLGSGLLLRALGATCGALASIAVAMTAASTELRSTTPIIALLALAGVLQAGWVAEVYLQVSHRFGAAARAKIAAYILSGVCRLIALTLPQPLVWLAAAAVVESLVAGVLLWRASSRQVGMGLSTLHMPRLEQTLTLALTASPMLLSALAIAIYTRIDVLMLSRMVGPEAAGIYSAGSLLSEGFYMVPTAVMAAVAPRLAHMHARADTCFDAHLYRFVRWLSLAGLAIGVATTLAAPYVVRLLFGEGYAPSIIVLQIHIWSTWAVFVSTASDPWYINHDLRKLYLLKTSVAAVLNVMLNLVLIPSAQSKGAAIATLVSYICSAILVGAFARSTRPLFAMQVRAIMGMPWKPARGRSG